MINLDKGGKVNLDKVAPGLTKAYLDLSWLPQMRDGDKFDLDAYCAVLYTPVGVPGRIPTDYDLVYLKNLCHPSGAISLSGDDQEGGKGERITIDFTKLPADAKRLVFAINIDKAISRKQNFGMVKGSKAILTNAVSNEPIVKCDLGEDYYKETCVIPCELYKREDGAWGMSNESSGYKDGLRAYLIEQGFEVEEQQYK